MKIAKILICSLAAALLGVAICAFVPKKDDRAVADRQDAEAGRASSCEIIYDHRRDVDHRSEATFYLERGDGFELYIRSAPYGGDDVVCNGETILGFVNVAAFEDVVYLAAEGKKYLYFYPGLLYNPDREEAPGVPEMHMAWRGLGIEIEFDDNGEYVIRKNLDYVDHFEICTLPYITDFESLGDDERRLFYTVD